MRSLLLLLTILVSASSCRTTQQVEKTSSEHKTEKMDSVNIRDSVRITDKLNIRDSIRVIDSTVIVVDEQGNVIRKELYRERNRYRNLESDYFSLLKRYNELYCRKQESISDTVYIEKEKALSRWQQMQQNMGVWAICSILIFLLIYKIRKTKR